MNIGVLIVDDQRLARSGMRRLLESEGDIDVVGEAGDSLEAVEVARRLKPDVVLMDLRTGGIDGVEATSRLVRLALEPRPRVLAVTTFDADESVYAALHAGASGLLLKDASREELVAAIRGVAAGEVLLTPSVTRRLIEQFARRPISNGIPPRLSTLSEREVEVLRLIARGLSNMEIAEALVLSESTVKSHLTHLFRKLGVRDRVQAVVLAYESGLIQPGG